MIFLKMIFLFGLLCRISRQKPKNSPPVASTFTPKPNAGKGASPPMLKKSTDDPATRSPEEARSKRRPKVSPRKEESRSRLASRLKRRLSRRKSKEAPEAREKLSGQYWSSAPRVKCYDASLAPNMLNNLVRSSSMRHGPPKTVSAQFQSSLVSLMERLEQTNPFFIRCIKSNNEKVHCYIQ